MQILPTTKSKFLAVLASWVAGGFIFVHIVLKTIFLLLQVNLYLFFFLRLFTPSQCIHNWPVTQEISNYFKFCRVWPVRWCMLHCRPCLELLGFWRLHQESSTEVTSKFRPSRLPWWRLTSHTLFIRHAYSRFSLTWENRNKNGNLLIQKV